MSGLLCLYTNADGLLGKIKELRLIANKFHIIGITETWASKQVFDAELSIEGFTVIRRDRCDRNGGGAILYVKDFLMPEEHTKLMSSEFEESAWCTVKIHSLQLLVGVCYHSPNSEDANNSQLLDLSAKASTIVNRNSSMRLMIMGDFN